METSEVLNLAADLIEKRGWAGVEVDILGDSFSPWGWDSNDSPVCLEGGIFVALGGSLGTSDLINECPAGVAMRDYLNVPPGDPLYRYNDKPGRTSAEVIEVLRACALIESAREQDSAWQTYATNVARVTA